MTHPDSIHFADSLQYKTLVTGRTIYGGGSIMPDVFVPIDPVYLKGAEIINNDKEYNRLLGR